ncbi:metalloregulator ArsR/SmtB family transcription factor [Rhizobium sp. LjRoot30]|uniref:ArsR/SmtB family transcription factor n=1 Tax=Rhizobium sp. LjRoot30 TaxID=3342320 RepID=UPI003ED12D55
MLHLERKAKILSAMANKKRLEILRRLIKKPYSFQSLVKILDLSPSALSQHLSVLQRQNLVKRKISDEICYYSSNDKRVFRILHALDKIVEEFSNSDPGSPIAKGEPPIIKSYQT